MSMSGILVTENAVRALVKELLSTNLPAVVNELPFQDRSEPIVPRPEVDTTVRAYDQIYSVPVGVNLMPHDKKEFEVVMKTYLVDVPDTSIPSLFKKMQKAFDEVALEDDDTEGLEMKIDTNKHPMSKNVEESIRKEIRRILKEAPPMTGGLGFSGFDYYGDHDDDETIRRRRETNFADISDETKLTYPEMIKKSHELKQKAKSAKTPEERAEIEKELNDLKYNTREMTQTEMAPTLDYAGPQGVKGEEYKTIQKAKFISDLSPPERNKLFSKARKGYLEWLKMSGELSEDEVKLLHSHPVAVDELDGFRDWLSAYIRDAMEGGTKWQTSQWNAAMKEIERVNPKALSDED